MSSRLRMRARVLVPCLFVCSVATGCGEDAGIGDDTSTAGGTAGTAGTAGASGSNTAGTAARGGTSGSTGNGGASGRGGAGGVGGTSGSGGSQGGTVNGGSSGSGDNGGAGGNGASGGSGKGGSQNGGSAGSAGTGFGGLGGGGNAGSSAGAGAAGIAGTGGATDPCPSWPSANGSQSVSSTIPVSGTYDGEFKRFVGSGPLGSSGQNEDQGALFELAPGATLKNVIIGSPAADGVHCEGPCTLENVWWEDVGEDAATFRGSSGSQTMTVRCGGAKNADDKVFQHNGAGTLTIENFEVETFGKLYRSCGNCSEQHERHVVLRDITARGGSSLVGINTNYDDTAEFSGITIYGNIAICDRYTGNSSGAEPVKTGSGSDGQYCLYEESDITQR